MVIYIGTHDGVQKLKRLDRGGGFVWFWVGVRGVGERRA